MTLKLDIDRGRVLPTVSRLSWLLRRAGYRLAWVSQTRSPSGTGWHVEVQTIPEIASALEVTALQAVLGSDPAREACNVQRARLVEAGQVSAYWRTRWNVLYSESR